MKIFTLDKASFESQDSLSINNANQRFDDIISLDNSHFPQPWTQQQWVDLSSSDSFTIYYLLDSADEVAGFALFDIFQQDSRAELHKMIISPRNREIGKGHDLLHGSLNCIVIRGIYNFVLEVSVLNDNAISLYQRVGFEIIREVKRFYSNGESAYTMQYLVNSN